VPVAIPGYIEKLPDSTYDLTNLINEEEDMLLNIILWIILGGIAGWLASLIMKTDAQMGAVANIVVGIVGALIGGFLMNLFGAAGATGFNLYSLLVAVVGAVVLLFLIRVLRGAF
jgi:uncharacterized membrane protein YeaQ/YmgE (transglycosylase-associated protein family)